MSVVDGRDDGRFGRFAFGVTADVVSLRIRGRGLQTVDDDAEA